MLSPKTACAAPMAATYCQYSVATPKTSAATRTTTLPSASSDARSARLRPNITTPPPDHDHDDDQERNCIGIPTESGRENDRLQHSDGNSAERGDPHVPQEAQ